MFSGYKNYMLSLLLMCTVCSSVSLRAGDEAEDAAKMTIWGITQIVLISGLVAERLYCYAKDCYETASFGQVKHKAKELIDLGETKNFYACCVLSESEYNNWCDDHDPQERQTSFVMSQAEFIVCCKREFAQNATPLMRAYRVLENYWIECAALNDVLASKSEFYESKGLPVREIQERLNKIISRIRRNLAVIEEISGMAVQEVIEEEDVPDNNDQDTATQDSSQE